MALIKLSVFLGVVCLTGAMNFNLTSPPITNWGDWGNFEKCPPGRYAQGFQLKTEPNQFFGDDTALNAIRLFCGDPFRPDTAEITSTQGDFGSWGHVYTCYPGVLRGFQMRVESDREGGDDTATNNVRFTCSEDPNDPIEGDGLFWGEWGDTQNCYGTQAICGIQTQMEPYLGDRDDSMLNNVRFECCDMARSELQAGYDYVQKNGAYPKKMSPEFAALLRMAVADELDNSSNNQQERVGKLNVAKLIRGPAGNGKAKKPTSIEDLLRGISEYVQKKQLEEGKKERQRIKFYSNVKQTLETLRVHKKSKGPAANGEVKKQPTIENVLRGVSKALQKKQLETAEKEEQRTKFYSSVKTTLENHLVHKKSKRPAGNGEVKKQPTIENVLRGVSEALQKKQLEQAKKEEQRTKFYSSVKTTLENHLAPKKSKKQ